MPIVPYDLQRRVKRFTDQRWLLDCIIDLIGPEWDQGRLHYLAGPCSPDYTAAILGLKSTMKKWDDISTEFTKAARRFELQAKAALDAGHQVTAGDGYFAAALIYGGAQWPIFENTPLNLALERKKTECYLEYAKHADHHVEAVEIPYRGKTLAGYYHVPPNHDGSRLPCIVMIEGMDGFKELALSASSDRFLRRGFACLCLDGPGQGTSLTREIWYDPKTYGEVGTAAYDAMAARPEVDPERVMVWGLSFGSFWATQMAAAESRYAACAVMYTCFQPTNWPMYEMASPSFTQRFMYMTGIGDEAQFDAFMPEMDVRPLSPRIKMPCLVMAGEDDALTDLNCTIDHLNNVVGPKTLRVYAGELHGFGANRSSQLSTPFFAYMADWLADRAAKIPLESSYDVVDSAGEVHSSAYRTNRRYEYGMPLDFRQLFDHDPQTGTA